MGNRENLSSILRKGLGAGATYIAHGVQPMPRETTRPIKMLQGVRYILCESAHSSQYISAALVARFSMKGSFDRKPDRAHGSSRFHLDAGSSILLRYCLQCAARCATCRMTYNDKDEYARVFVWRDVLPTFL
jgi:hypothetical protein